MKNLILSHNQLSSTLELESALKKMKNLRLLNVSENQLEGLFILNGSMMKIKDINLSVNKLQ